MMFYIIYLFISILIAINSLFWLAIRLVNSIIQSLKMGITDHFPDWVVLSSYEVDFFTLTFSWLVLFY